MTEDGGFPDLANHCKAKLKKLDPKFKLPEDFNKYTPEEENAANKDVLSFLSDMENADKKLKRERDENGGEIFPDSSKENKNANNSFASDVHRKRKAEEDRLKGNEFMKAKEYQEAIDCYTKSLDIFEEAATFGNRAMANLRLKRYGQVIEDSNEALRIDPNYIKAHHRRGKAYLATKKYELAIKDFQIILAKENDKDINKDLMDARAALKKQEEAAASNGGMKIEEASSDEEQQPVVQEERLKPKPMQAQQPQNTVPKVEDQKFKRVVIQEDSDDNEEETPT